MKNLSKLGTYRRIDPRTVSIMGSVGNDNCGVFDVPHPRTGVILYVVAANGLGWDHVSVSLPNRCPNWIEMEHVKRLFFEDDETAIKRICRFTTPVYLQWKPLSP